MRKSKGFTLIELLAVIVILSIILLIAVPVISNIIESTKKSAFNSSAEMIAKTAENEFLKKQLDGNTTPIKVVFENSVITEGDLSFSGDKPKSGTVLVNKKGRTAYALYNGKYCSEKSFLEDNAATTETTEGECILEEPVPIVTLLGAATIDVVLGQEYIEPGFTAVDENGEVTTNVVTEITDEGIVVASIDTTRIGRYIIKYVVTGEELTGEITREVNVIFQCGTDFNDTRDGKVYSTIQIGTQCWFSDNLAYTTPSCLSATWNDVAPHDACRVSGGAGWNQFEVQYQWGALMNGTPTDGAQGLCPTGWHVSTDNEWKVLEMHIGMTQAQADAIDYRGTNQATQLKDNILWDGTNTVGFSALPTGHKGALDTLLNFGIDTGWWTSTPSGADAWRRYLNGGNATFYRSTATTWPGFSARCVLSE